MTAPLQRLEKVAEQCAACPFGDKPEGVKIRDGMGPFYDAIVDGIKRRRAPFYCHKTNPKTSGVGPERLCLGALAIQPKPRCIIVEKPQ